MHKQILKKINSEEFMANEEIRKIYEENKECLKDLRMQEILTKISEKLEIIIDK